MRIRSSSSVVVAAIVVLAAGSAPAGGSPAATTGRLARPPAVRALSLPSLPFFGSPRVDVEVRERPATDVWEVHYRFPRAIAGIELPHGRGAYRRQAWGVPSAAAWVDAPAAPDGNTPERLCFARATRDLRVSFRSDFATRRKDYELEVSMSDGGRLFYTGQLVVRPLARCGAGTDAEPLPGPLAHRFRFVTDSGRTIRAGDRVGSGTLDWQPETGHEETYVYLGPQSATTGARSALVVDPALPAWLRSDLDPLVAKLLDRFAAETAVALPRRPLVLLGYDASGSGSSFDGGVLDNVVTLSARGEGWSRQSAEERRRWVVRLAHELFHLWDGAVYAPDGESEWLSEALAEEMALRAAWGIGELDAAQLAATRIDLANRCLLDIGTAPLLDAVQRGTTDTWYTCGPTLLWVADRAVDRKHPGQGGLGLLLRDMLQEAAPAHTYGTGLFLGWLDKLSADRATVFALQGVIRRGVPSHADALLARLLEGGGLPVELVPAEEAHASPEVYGALLRRGLVRCACGDPGGAAPEPGSDCARLAGGARLAGVGDVDPRQDPAAAFARLRAAANLGRPLRVATAGEAPALTLFCDRDAIAGAPPRLLRPR